MNLELMLPKSLIILNIDPKPPGCQNRTQIIRTYVEEENYEAIFRRSGSEFIILRMHL
jgi:hypothetical protein